MFPFFYYFIVIAVSTLLVLIILPSIIHVAQKLNLFDDNSIERKKHGYGIPRLGGVAFYISIILTSLVVIAKNGTGLPLYDLYAASIILFAMGVKDDLAGVNCHTKFAIQAVVAFLITVSGNIHITNLYGVFNIYELNYIPSIIISVFVIIFIINSFNLIDGIDGLAGTLGVIACCTFGFYFMLMGRHQLTAIAFSMAGSLIAFLAYNYSPARIFMGDCGSMFLGMVCSVFAIKFMSINEASAALNIHAAPAFATAVLIIPVFDTCSVVISRIYNKKSPFMPDRNHVHHRMLLLGLTHMQTTLILATVNLIFIGLALVFKQANNTLLLLLFAVILLLLNGLINYLLSVKNKQVFRLGNLIG